MLNLALTLITTTSRRMRHRINYLLTKFQAKQIRSDKLNDRNNRPEPSFTTALISRGIGVGLCSGVSRIGGVAGIAIIMLRSISPTLPYAIFGVLAFLAGERCRDFSFKSNNKSTKFQECWFAAFPKQKLMGSQTR